MIQPLPSQPGRAAQAYQALLDAICDGSLEPGSHLVQEQLATRLGVSRQPVQQALAILKTEGLVIEQGGRGLFVAPLDVVAMRHHYEIRAALDGLAARRAAERGAADPAAQAEISDRGADAIDAGRKALKRGRVADMVMADIAFHSFIYEASGNPLLASSAEPHWRQLRRIMSEVLRRAQAPAEVWRQHEAILDAIRSGDAELAARLATEHVDSAQRRLQAALGTPQD